MVSLRHNVACIEGVIHSHSEHGISLVTWHWCALVAFAYQRIDSVPPIAASTTGAVLGIEAVCEFLLLIRDVNHHHTPSAPSFPADGAAGSGIQCVGVHEAPWMRQ